MTPADPVAAARDAETLLRTGRANMALRILEALPSVLEAALKEAASEAYLRGQTDTHRMMAAARERHPKGPRQAPATPPKPNRLDELRAALADPAKRAAVRSALRMDDRLLDRIAAGGANLTPAQRRRLRSTLA